MGENGDSVGAFLSEVVDRRAVLTALDGEPRSRSELEAELGVSKATVHRATTTLSEHGLVARVDGGYGLTELGTAITGEMTDFRESLASLRQLGPLLEELADSPVAVDPDLFREATVTEPRRHNPYHPVERFIELLSDADAVRGFDATTLTPGYDEAVYSQIESGMEVEVIYPSTVVEELLARTDERGAELIDRENLTVRVYEEIPFGLTLCDDRLGIGCYDRETGMLECYVDTDAPEALAWGEEVFERYWQRSRPLDDDGTDG